MFDHIFSFLFFYLSLAGWEVHTPTLTHMQHTMKAKTKKQDKEIVVFGVSQMIRDRLLETGCGISWR